MLERLCKDDFDGIFHIMKASFPADETRSYDAQKALFDKKEYSAYGIRSDQGSIAAFITLWRFTGFTFGEHFAVAQELRGAGLGSKIINEASETAEERFCLEVEPPITNTAKRRIAFYERNGFVLNDYDYIQPSLSENTEAVRLMMMSCKKGLSKQEFEIVKSTVYQTVYGVSENYGGNL